jgi:hypothetical protein
MRDFQISAHNVDFTNMELVAARRFTLDGKELNEGDVLPEGALTQRRARQMFERRMIKLRSKGTAEAAPEAAPVAEQPVEAPEATNTPAEPVEAASAPDSAAQEGAIEVTAEKGFRAEHEGFGRWYVYGPSGDKVSGPHKKAKIEHLIVD